MTCCTWVCCRSYSSRTLSCLQMIGSCQHTLSPLLLVMRDPSPPLGEESRILAKINNDELNIDNLIYCNCTLHYIRSIPLHRMTPSLEMNISMICVYIYMIVYVDIKEKYVCIKTYVRSIPSFYWYSISMYLIVTFQVAVWIASIYRQDNKCMCI